MIRRLVKRGLKKILGGAEPAPEPKPYPFKYTPPPAEAASPTEEPATPAPAEVAAPTPAPTAAIVEPQASAPQSEASTELPEDLSLLTVKELRAELKSRSIDLKSRELKTDLIKKLASTRAAGGAEAEDAPTEGSGLDRAVVQELLDEMVRPALQGDGGDISLVKVEGMDVHVRLVGACTTCPSSIMTMKLGIEALFREEFPGFGQLIQVDQP